MLTIKTYKKKPEIVRGVLFEGESIDEITLWINESKNIYSTQFAWNNGFKIFLVKNETDGQSCIACDKGDFIVLREDGFFYRYKDCDFNNDFVLESKS
jgi:hypothetical protein